jgi:hypothetical protein
MAREILYKPKRMEDRVIIERDTVLLILKQMIEVLEKGETDLIIQAQTGHNPTYIGKNNGWDEWREGNRSYAVLVKENEPVEYYLSKYGITEKPRRPLLDKLKSVFK